MQCMLLAWTPMQTRNCRFFFTSEFFKLLKVRLTKPHTRINTFTQQTHSQLSTHEHMPMKQQHEVNKS